jgi:hypothetical protein
MSRTLAAVLTSLLAVLSLATAAGAAGPASVPSGKGDGSFDVVARVLLSPRCRNCHPAGDRPLQHDDGRLHAQEVGRKATKLGLDCSACHQASMPVEPMAGPHLPPGAPNWSLPPEKTPMVFEGRTPAELCKQLKDPAQTGGKDLATLLHHVAEDELVDWAWHPGEGRTPVAVPKEEFVAAFRAWIDAGAACPPAAP